MSDFWIGFLVGAGAVAVVLVPLLLIILNVLSGMFVRR